MGAVDNIIVSPLAVPGPANVDKVIVQECVSIDNVGRVGSFFVSPLAVSVQRTLVIELKYSTKSMNSYSFNLIIELDMIAR